MVQLECLVCGANITVPDFVDTENFEGHLSCRQCGSIFHVRLVGSKARKFELVEKKSPLIELSATADRGQETLSETKESPGELEDDSALKNLLEDNLDVKKIAKYNALRDFLATYVAKSIHLSFEQIENLVGGKLDEAAYTLKSWWANDRSHPQALSWLEAGWVVADVNFPQRIVVLNNKNAKPSKESEE